MSKDNATEPVVTDYTSNVIRSITSKTGAGDVNYIDANGAVSDNQLLAEIGYKQELKRRFSTLQVFGVAFSIMGLLPSIASVMAGGLTGGPATLLWGWFVAGFFILLGGITMAENSSAIPTAGGLYYWTYHYAPEKYKVIFSFMIGCSNSLALTAGVCAISYGFSKEILAAVVISKDGEFIITNGKTYGVFVAAVVAMLICTCFSTTSISYIQTTSIYANCFIIILLFIALPVGTKINRGKLNRGSFIFGSYENLSDWNDGWQFCLAGFMPAVWTIGAFDSCVHQSEEAKDAKRAVPIGIVGSISVCWILGFLILIVILACMDQDIQYLLQNPYGFVLAQIIYDSLGKNWAIAFMSLLAFCQFLMGSSAVVAVSRQVWAFSRDNGLPFSRYIKRVNRKLSVPIIAAWVAGCGSLILGLLCLIGNEAASALFSLGVAANNLAWATPTILRLTSGRDVFRPGPFYLGKIMSPIICWTSVLFQLFLVILVMFPTMQHGITKATMNYACVITPGVWIVALSYFSIYGHKYYHGPVTNLEDEEYIDIVGSEVLDEVLSRNASI